MASDIWIDLALSSLGFVNHFAYVYTTFDMKPCSWHAPWHRCLAGGSKIACLGKPGDETKAVGCHLLGCSLRSPGASVSEWLPFCGNCGVLLWLATAGFSRLCWKKWYPVRATRITQESRTPETPIYNLVQMLSFELSGTGTVLHHFCFYLEATVIFLVVHQRVTPDWMRQTSLFLHCLNLSHLEG